MTKMTAREAAIAKLDTMVQKHHEGREAIRMELTKIADEPIQPGDLLNPTRESWDPSLEAVAWLVVEVIDSTLDGEGRRIEWLSLVPVGVPSETREPSRWCLRDSPTSHAGVAYCAQDHCFSLAIAERALVRIGRVGSDDLAAAQAKVHDILLGTVQASEEEQAMLDDTLYQSVYRKVARQGEKLQEYHLSATVEADWDEALEENVKRNP